MCDEARVKLFCMGQAQDKLLRTSDAAQLHIRWAHHQSRVWNQGNCSSPFFLSGNQYGVETHGLSFSATLAFSPTYHKSML